MPLVHPPSKSNQTNEILTSKLSQHSSKLLSMCGCSNPTITLICLNELPTFVAPTFDVCKIINVDNENEEEPLKKK
jgi:hypothetical protein